MSNYYINHLIAMLDLSIQRIEDGRCVWCGQYPEFCGGRCDTSDNENADYASNGGPMHNKFGELGYSTEHKY